MAAHRYWRLVGFAVAGAGPLELSEVQLYAGGARVGDTVVPTCPFAPTSGALADLSDGLTTGVVAWPASAHRSPGFALVWDLTGAGADVTVLWLGAGNSANTFLLDVTLQWSDDAIAWTTTAGARDVAYPGPYSLTAAAAANYAAVVMADSPLGYWKMDEASGTAMVDSSGNGRTGTYGALATLGAPGIVRPGTSVYVTTTGTALVATVPDDAALRLTSDFTLEWWGVPTSSGVVLSKEQGGSIWPSWSLVILSGKPKLELRKGDSSGVALTLTAASSIIDGMRHHVMVTKIGTAVVLWVDNVAVASGTFAGSVWSSTAPVGIACRYAPGYDSVALKGITDAVSIYGSGLSAARVAAHYDAGILSGGLPESAASKRLRNGLASPVSISGSALPNGAASSHLREYAFFDADHGGLGVIYGTVKEKNTLANTPLRRKVWLLDERSGLVIRETWSDAATGAYAFRGIKQGMPYTVLAYDHAHNYRAFAGDNLLPDPMP